MSSDQSQRSSGQSQGASIPNSNQWLELAKLDLIVLSAENLGERDPGIDPGNFSAEIAVSPKTPNAVRDVVLWCSRNDVSIVAQGGRTGLSGGATSSKGQLVVMMERINGIREIDPKSRIAVVDAGVILSQLEEELKPHDLTLGVDLSARGSCTIGGMIATNAGGSDAFRNGVMRHRVLGLEAVLPDGAILSDLKRVVKANEGYDIKQLLIGSEGTLGIITGAVLKLEKAVGQRQTVLAAVRSTAAAVSFFHRLRNEFGARLLAIEIMWNDYFKTICEELKFDRDYGHLEGDAFVIVDVSCEKDGDELLEILGQSLEAGDISDALIAKNEQERKNFWLVREETLMIDKRFPGGCWFDISVPLNQLDRFLDRTGCKLKAIDPDLGVYIVGHLGDGNLHYTIAKDAPIDHLCPAISEAIFTGLNEIGGSFSAEHGIGIEKRAALSRYGDPAKNAMMNAIKKTIDPKNILNPGKIMSD